jgi:hypothetical protein
MNHETVLKDLVVGIVANHGLMGATPGDIDLYLPLSVVERYREEVALEHSKEVVLRVILGQLIKAGILETSAPGGIVRYVVKRRDLELEKEIAELKAKVARLERLLGVNRR